jgi:enamine deaminase RidA (YjgF/YER057c/UK114 family)
MLSGQIAFANGKLVGKGDPEAQTRQCFANITECLAGVGADLSHVVKINAYFTDIAAYPAYSKLKSELFRVNPPTGTGVIVSGLLVPDALMEIEVVAYREA